MNEYPLPSRPTVKPPVITYKTHFWAENFPRLTNFLYRLSYSRLAFNVALYDLKNRKLAVCAEKFAVTKAQNPTPIKEILGRCWRALAITWTQKQHPLVEAYKQAEKEPKEFAYDWSDKVFVELAKKAYQLTNSETRIDSKGV